MQQLGFYVDINRKLTHSALRHISEGPCVYASHSDLERQIQQSSNSSTFREERERGTGEDGESSLAGLE